MTLQLKIGQIAQLSGITPKTIRHYHKLGLLPQPERAENGYRIYRIESLYRIQLIKSLKQVGFSLKDIQAIITSANPTEQLHKHLYEMQQQLADEIKQLQQRQTRIHTLILNEVTLDETRLIEYPVLMNLFADITLSDNSSLPPELIALEHEFYQQMDQYQWGEDYQQLMQEMAGFLQNNPTFLQEFAHIFDAAQPLSANDPQLPNLAQTLAHLIDQTPIQTYLQNQLQLEDKTLYQAFLELSENQLAPHISAGQKQLLILVESHLKN